MTYQESIPKNITTSVTAKPNQPQIIIENTSDKEIFCNLIEILPNVDFAINGVLEIEIDDVTVLDSKHDSFRQYSKYPLPLGKQIQGRGEVRIFAWNKNNSDEIKCGFNIHLADKIEHIPSVASPLSQDQKINAISEFETIFPYMERSIGTYPQLIDMRGYKKLIVLISAIVYLNPPTPLANDFGAPIYDGSLTTYSEVSLGANGSKVAELDFGSIASRNLAAKIHSRAISSVGGSVTGTFTLEYRNSLGDGWTAGGSTNISASGGTDTGMIDKSISAGMVSFRYARLTWSVTMTTGQLNICRLFEIYDASAIGGSGQLSFEIQDSLGNWATYIPASEFGTVAFLGSPVVAQVGDVNTKSISGQTYALPSTQTKFRALYTISTSKVSNAIDIQRVA